MRIRESRGISLVELAEWAGLSPRTLFNLERGRDARMSTWLRVLSALEEWIPPERFWQEIPLPEVRRKARLNKTERDIVELLENERGRDPVLGKGACLVDRQEPSGGLSSAASLGTVEDPTH